jgi:hypothetical protein
VAHGLSIGLSMSEYLPRTNRQDESHAVLWALSSSASLSEAEGIEIRAGFHKRPRAMEARRRVVYRTSLLVLVLSRFNGNAAKLQNVHLFIWATRTARTRRLLSGWWSGRRYATTQLQKLDPDLQITIGLAIADGLVAVTGNNRQRIRLTAKGEGLAHAINGDEELLAVEKRFLETFPRLSDAAVARNLGVSSE